VPYRLAHPPQAQPSTSRRSGPLPLAVFAARRAEISEDINASSHALGSRPESCDRTSLLASTSAKPMLLRAPFHGVSCPTTLTNTKQRPTPGVPHLAVLRPQAFSASRRFDSAPCLPALFHAGTPLGFHLQRIPLHASRHASRRALPLMPFHRAPKNALAAPGIDASLESVRSGPVLPGDRRSSLSWRCPLRGVPPSGLGPVLPQDLLSWAW
jgi:hypothetical protein